MAIRGLLDEAICENIPTELLESAKIDGCGELRTFWSVAFPIVKPDLQPLPSLPLSTPGTTTLCNWYADLSANLTISLGLRPCRLKWPPTMA